MCSMSWTFTFWIKCAPDSTRLTSSVPSKMTASKALFFQTLPEWRTSSSQRQTAVSKALKLLFYLTAKMKSIYHCCTRSSRQCKAFHVSRLSLSPPLSGCSPASASSRSSRTRPTCGSCSSEPRTATRSLSPNWRRLVVQGGGSNVRTPWLWLAVLSEKRWGWNSKDKWELDYRGISVAVWRLKSGLTFACLWIERLKHKKDTGGIDNDDQ